MTRSKKLRAKLKSADKRRRRRAVAHDASDQGDSGPDQGFDTHPRIDVTGILVDAVLCEADQQISLRDSAIVAATKSILNGSSPRSAEATAVNQRMTRMLDASKIAPNERIKAARDLMELAQSNMDPDVPDQFIRYLSLLVV